MVRPTHSPTTRMSSLASASLAGALRARLAAKSPASTGSSRAATVRPARASARDEEGARDPTPERALARFAVAAAASVAVALPTQAAAPVAQVALSVDEQIAEEVAKYDGMKASCKNEACRVTTQSWEDAAVKKIKKKNGVAVEKPKGQTYPSAPKAAAPAPKVAETAPEQTPAATAPAPKAETPPAEAKAEAKARLAERQAASAAAAEAAAADKVAKAAAAKQASEDAAAEKAAAIRAKAAEAEAAKQAKARAKEAPAPAPAPAAKKAAPAAKKSAPAAKKSAPAAKKKTASKKSASPVDAALGDAVVLALAGGAGIALAKPSVKDKALGGDAAAALEEAKAFVASTEGVVGKAAAAGAIVAADAAAHLPVLGFLLPGPLEYVGACAAALLAARYYVTKDSSVEEDLANLGARLPSSVPAADDLFVPARAAVGQIGDWSSDFDFAKTKGDVTEWFNGLEDPVETIAPPAAALFVANLIVYAAHFPVVSLAAPRALELAGAAVAVAAVEKYGAGGGKFQEDLGRYAARGGDAVKRLIEK